MELIATFITGVVSIFMAILKNGWSNRKRNEEILAKLEALSSEIQTQGVDLLQIKMDKYIAKCKSRQIISETELKELSETYERYHNQGGNGYYSEAISKIIKKYALEERRE